MKRKIFFIHAYMYCTLVVLAAEFRLMAAITNVVFSFEVNQ